MDTEDTAAAAEQSIAADATDDQVTTKETPGEVEAEPVETYIGAQVAAEEHDQLDASTADADEVQEPEEAGAALLPTDNNGISEQSAAEKQQVQEEAVAIDSEDVPTTEADGQAAELAAETEGQAEELTAEADGKASTELTAEAAEAAEAQSPPPAASSTSSSESSEESESDDAGSEADDTPGELPAPLAAAADNDDDTKSDASEGELEAEERPTTEGDIAGEVDGQLPPMSPRSAAARERRLQKRLTSFDKRQEKFSQMKAAVKTHGVNMEVVIGKWKRLREDYIKLRANSVLSSGDDGSMMITRRMTEIGNMCSRTTNAAFYIATLPERVQVLIQKMMDLSREDFTEVRRRNWGPYDRFLYAGRMARVLAQACLARRRLTIEALANGRAMLDKDLVTNSISKTLRDCMSYCPEYRTKEMRQKILWFLRTNKVYTHLFSSEMEEECTKFVFYEKYQDGRILSLTDRLPEKFYYVISGKIERRKTYELRAGDYDRVFSVITKGQTSDVEQMELQKPKKFTLVAGGLTEVLTLDREDFFHLLKGTGGLPLRFLQNIGIFQEFPCEKFLTSPEAITTRYFPKDRVILDDIMDTPWIHVIKSGTAKVVRKQLVFHYARNKYSHNRAIGYAKTSSHSGAMQGLTERQRQYKTEKLTGWTLPELHQRRRAREDATANPLGHTIGLPEPPPALQQPSQQQPTRLPKVTSAPNGGEAANGAQSGETTKPRRNRPRDMTARELRIPLRSAGSVRGPSARASASGGARLGAIVGGPRPASRQRTAQVLLGPDGFQPDRPKREAYVVLDTLRSGDFLGFRNITMLIDGERIKRDRKNVLTLLSEGAEIIRISKRFFVQNAANNTMLKAETMSREFASKDEASLSIDAKEDWEMFKAAFIQRMVGHQREEKKKRLFSVT